MSVRTVTEGWQAMKRSLVLALLTVVVALAAVTGASAATSRTAAYWPAQYHQVLVNNFCDDYDTTAAACRCYTNYIEGRYSITQFVSMTTPRQQKQFVLGIMYACYRL